MAENKEVKNVFVSHYHEDEDSIKAFKGLLNDSYCIKNYSVTSDKFNNAKNEDYIKYGYLKPLINQKHSCLFDWTEHS